MTCIHPKCKNIATLDKPHGWLCGYHESLQHLNPEVALLAAWRAGGKPHLIMNALHKLTPTPEDTKQ